MFRPSTEGSLKTITANRLGDGRVVFLGPDGGWHLFIADAVVLADGPDLKAAEAYAKAQHDARIVVEPYTIDVRIEGGAPVPKLLRERIRAEGPTVRYGEEEVAMLREPIAP